MGVSRLRWLPESSRHRLKASWKQARANLIQRLYGFTAHDLREQLCQLGLSTGDVVIVHSSFDRFEGFDGKASDVIEVLQEVVGPSGTILMPTIPFAGSALRYIAGEPVFDVRRTPSKMGLITELFRRSPGVLRSLHPTHSVAAWGGPAAVLIAGHHLAATPCGVGSPYARLLDYDGKILLLGTGIGAMTFYHSVEELLEADLPFSPFTEQQYTLKSRDADGRLVTSTVRLFDPDWSRRRNLQPLVPVLRGRGAWRSGKVGLLDMILLDARAVLDACSAMARTGIYCYQDFNGRKKVG